MVHQSRVQKKAEMWDLMAFFFIFLHLHWIDGRCLRWRSPLSLRRKQWGQEGACLLSSSVTGVVYVRMPFWQGRWCQWSIWDHLSNAPPGTCGFLLTAALPWRLRGVKTVRFILKATVIAFVLLTFSDRFLLSEPTLAPPIAYTRYPISSLESIFGGRACSTARNLLLTLHSSTQLRRWSIIPTEQISITCGVEQQTL